MYVKRQFERSGALDPPTPPDWARTVALTLPNSQSVTFSAMGHNVTSSRCGQELQTAFIEEPLGKVDTSCLANQKVDWK